MTNTLVLTQYRKDSDYNDFIGKFYHFPGNPNKSYLKQFDKLPIEFVYYEPKNKNGSGEFFGYGKICKKPFEDKREKGYYFVEIDDYKLFSKPVSYKNDNQDLIESIENPFYNPQNAVRKIPSQLLENICLGGEIILNIKSDAHLIKILGEQLIASEKIGVLELVKNAIDAQASYCQIRLENIKSLRQLDSDDYQFSEYPGPVIIIDDDGIGMDKRTIELGWLRPASTLKTKIKEELRLEREKAQESGNLGAYDAIVDRLKKEHGKRIPLGEKGVGRFATHRLGRFLEVRTKTSKNDYELVLKIDWNRFDVISDDFIDLDSIGISLTKDELSRDYTESNSGTRLIIYGGKEGFEWDEKSIQELNRTILNLNSPSTKLKKKYNYDFFDARLEVPQIEELPKNLIFEETDPNFELIALVNEKGIAEISELTFKHPTGKMPSQTWEDKNYDLKKFDKDNPKYWKDETDELRKPECGSFLLNLSVWYRASEWIGLPNYRDLINYLDDFGGISIYRDNILIYDAKLGAETDWLELSKKHIKQGFRVSYREIIGNIDIEQTENINLIDKTNREGFINNKAFSDLSILTKNIIESIILPRFIAKRSEFKSLTKGIVSDAKTLGIVVKNNSKLLGNITDSDYPFGEDPYTFFDGLWNKADERRDELINLKSSMKELKKSLQMMEEVQSQFVEQAGFGISVAISLHEINKITSNFYHSIVHLLKSKQYDKLRLEELKTSSQSLKTELKRLGPLKSIRNERRMEFDVRKSVEFTKELFSRKMEKDEIIFEIINPEESFQIYGRYRALNQVIGNIFDNSLYWIAASNTKSNKIAVKFSKRFKTIIFADSGKDIDEIIRPYLFQPGYSLRVPPSGLGLYICKTYLSNMKARIYETHVKNRIGLDGAHFTIDFSRTPTYKE